LQGKLFCGYCGSPMVAESGRSSTGNVYYYYSCAKRNKHRDCKKKNEKKDFIEWYIVEQICEYVLEPKRLEYIAGRVVETYNADLGNEAVEELEKRLRSIDAELDKVTTAIINATTRGVIDRMNERAEALELEKADAEIDLARLRVAAGIKLQETEVAAFLRGFCQGDPLDLDFRREIIDAFLNSVYLYDDKLVMYFNVKDGKQISFIEMLSDSEEPGGEDYIEDENSSSLNGGGSSANR